MELLTSMAFVLGIGACNNAGDYCPDPVGKAAVELTLAEQQRHSILFEATHYSEVGNGEPFNGDRGSEFFMLEYKYTINF